jgi:hypothetical protein
VISRDSFQPFRAFAFSSAGATGAAVFFGRPRTFAVSTTTASGSSTGGVFFGLPGDRAGASADPDSGAFRSSSTSTPSASPTLPAPPAPATILSTGSLVAP